jgi:hypothetical protein
MSVSPLAPTSRYFDVEIAELQRPNGTTIAYLRRRFVPAPERFATLQEHTVTHGDRPDTIAAVALGDPERFWMLCDANRVLRPEELTAAPGATLRITLPEGIPGGTPSA